LQQFYLLTVQRYKALPALAKKSFFSLLFFVLTYKLITGSIQKDLWEFNFTISLNHIFLLFLVLALTPLNWFLEAKKWKLLSSDIEDADLPSAYREVLAGVFTSFLSPNRAGEFVGKILMRSPKNRVALFFRSVVGSMLQLLVTLIIGLISYFFLFSSSQMITEPRYFFYTLVFSGLSIMVLIFTFFKPTIALKPFFRFSFKLKRNAVLLRNFNLNKRFTVLGFSLFRYLVFSSQLIILLSVFGHSAPLYYTFCLVAVIYLVSTVIPTPLMAELGVREAASAAIFTLFGFNAAPALVATFLLWVFNLAIPAFLGWYFLTSRSIKS
jgi:uncharacterized membrane protein YbhN (UPF0104 family)